MRASYSCGWRGDNRYPVEWDAGEAYPEPYVDDSDARDDWDRCIDQVESGTVPLPGDFLELLEQLRERLNALENDSPLAALRAVGAVERLIRDIGWRVAFDVDPEEVSWDEMGKALGMAAGADLRWRLLSYRPENSRGWYWASPGERL